MGAVESLDRLGHLSVERHGALGPAGLRRWLPDQRMREGELRWKPG